MSLIQHRPVTPSQRYRVRSVQSFTNKNPESNLLLAKTRSSGRNCYGRITSRRRGGGHKRFLRIVDFKRNKLDIPAKVIALEYDPNRSANLLLLSYADGEKSYILAPEGVNIGDIIFSTNASVENYKPGISMRLRYMPAALFIHAIELLPNCGAQIARGAGVAAQLVAVEGDKATLKMPSGEIRYVHADCRATIGVVGNSEHQGIKLGKAGRSRWLGKRPRVRGVAMNPVDHPMGGGQGKTSGGGHPVSPWGQLAKSFPTRLRSKPSNSMILVRRNGRKVKR